MLKRILVLFLFSFSILLFSVQPYKYRRGMRICDFKNDFRFVNLNNRAKHLPQSLLVFRVQFSDVKFNLEANTPDLLSHNYQYFEKYMEHLQEYLLDASHGLYTLNYTVSDSVITLDKTMGFYGDDEEWSSRIAQFVADTIQKADPEIDFSQYDSFMIFHAGAGQESDITGNQTAELWSTFITKSDLKEELAPDDDNWEGIPTNEGTYVTQMPILPETEWQPDYDESSTNLGMMGVIAHEFGHELGLPTLFDNDSSNGRSAGIGNFGIMGTGAWNANGFVPPLPCAWSRYFLGWENPLEINNSVDNVSLTYPLSKSDFSKLVKINISDKEYFLLENRQENPDKSILNGQDSFTFTLLDDGQQYYPPPYDNIPKFDFMTNSYRNCEWDFYLPGLGGPTIPPEADGSGILIWHIDENIIDENLTPDLEENSINGNSLHKGVDLEEADGIQQMDSYYPDTYMFGGPFDSFRAGNNNYFGYPVNPENNNISQPSSESYYGGIPFEIKNISPSDSIMTFDVKFPWNLQTNYVGENLYPPTIISSDNQIEIFYPMPDGTINTWIDTTKINTIKIDSLSAIYSYDEENGVFLIPSFENNTFTVNKMFDSTIETTFSIDNYKTDFPILIFPNSMEVKTDANSESFLAKAVVGLNNIDETNSELIFLSENYENCGNLLLSKKISSNLILFENSIYFISKDSDSQTYLEIFSLDNSTVKSYKIGMFDNQDIVTSISLVPLMVDSTIQNPQLIISVKNKIYLSDLNGNISFKKEIPLNNSAVPNFADVDKNGTLDILIGGENKFVALDYNGNILNTQDEEISNPDTLGIASGVIQVNNGNKNYILGNFSKNRFVRWQNHSYINSFEIYHPYTLRNRSRTLPAVSEIDGNIYCFVGLDDGDIIRINIGEGELQSGWLYKFGDLKRSGIYHWNLPSNNYETRGVFVKSQVNIYPVPFIQSINSFLNTIVKVNKTTDVTLKIYDISGRCIFNETKKCYKNLINKNVFLIPSEKYSSGVYFARFKAENEYLLRKFIVEK